MPPPNKSFVHKGVVLYCLYTANYYYAVLFKFTRSMCNNIFLEAMIFYFNKKLNETRVLNHKRIVLQPPSQGSYSVQAFKRSRRYR